MLRLGVPPIDAWEAPLLRQGSSRQDENLHQICPSIFEGCTFVLCLIWICTGAKRVSGITWWSDIRALVRRKQVADTHLIVDLHDILSHAFIPGLILSNQCGMQGHSACKHRHGCKGSVNCHPLTSTQTRPTPRIVTTTMRCPTMTEIKVHASSPYLMSIRMSAGAECAGTCFSGPSFAAY
jgi:hypothetical protein